MKLSKILVLLLFFFLFGCGLKEGVIQKDARSYLWFTGNTKDAIVLIDDLTPFNLNTANEKESGAKTRYYEVAPGKHTIVVTRNNKEIVKRIVLLGDGITKEIQIP
ncbi:MAG: hypothetical protein MI863_23350 [Desulfobacterales bacterium]|nr:hypothetical protein [Desulfobacterales bacterium]